MLSHFSAIIINYTRLDQPIATRARAAAYRVLLKQITTNKARCYLIIKFTMMS